MTVEDYTRRIANSTPLGLVIVNYELLINNLHLAKDNCDKAKYDEFELHLKKSQAYLMVLMSSLDMTFDISKELLEIYLYSNKLLINAYFKRESNNICACCDILGSLLDSWRIISKAESKETPPVMENVEKMIAGLTYKDGQLSEYIMGSENRGIKA